MTTNRKISYFCGMKKHLLQMGSLLMALVVLFVSVGWDVKFHYCTEAQQLTSRLSTATELCWHCLDHEDDHATAEIHLVQSSELQINAKCCCEDFDSKIQFTDNYVFSPEKHLDIHFQPVVFTHLNLQELLPKAQQAFHHFTPRKIPHFFTARDRLVFFSALRLNPLVF